MRQIQFIDKFVDVPVSVQTDPEIELEVSTPVVEYTASASAVTDIVATAGVNLEMTDLMNPLLSITDGEASTPPVADPSRRKRKGSDIIQYPHEVGNGAREGRSDGDEEPKS